MCRRALDWERLDRIIRDLDARGATVANIARQAGISERSVKSARARLGLEVRRAGAPTSVSRLCQSWAGAYVSVAA